MKTYRSLAARLRSVTGPIRLVALGFSVLALASGPSSASTVPTAPLAWPSLVCAVPTDDNCWRIIPNAASPIQDSICSGDATYNTSCAPTAADFWSGSLGTMPSVYMGYMTNGTATATDDFLALRIRLKGDPVKAPDRGEPYITSLAWLWSIDLNGDGWNDFQMATDGNYQKISVARNFSRVQQDLPSNTAGIYKPLFPCTGNPAVTEQNATWMRDAWVGAAPAACSGGTTNRVCDFGWTRVLTCDAGASNPAACFDTSTQLGGYILDMQFPLETFDACNSADADGDVATPVSVTYGDQLIAPYTPFQLCATTSTQVNDPTLKDLAQNGTYNSHRLSPLWCSDPLSLEDGPVQTPIFSTLGWVCPTGGATNPVTLTATILDTLAPVGGVLQDTLDDMTFYYGPSQSGPWTQAVAYNPAPPTNSNEQNPVLAPTAFLSEWQLLWNTTGVANGTYYIRLDIDDSPTNNNDFIVYFSNPITVGPGCTDATTPVSLAYFATRSRDGRVAVEWETATEVGTLGFNIHGETAGGWSKLNRQPIPTQGGASLEPRAYRRAFRDRGFTRFALEEIDVRGRSTLKGPFPAGQARGRRASAAERIDWDSIAAASAQRASERATLLAGEQSAVDASLLAARLVVGHDGVHRVSYEALQAAGIDFAGVRHADLALTRGGVAVPLWMSAPAATFGPGTFFEFVGTIERTLYADEGVYRLAIDAKRAARIATDKPPKPAVATTVAPAVRTFERNREYDPASPAADPWYDTWMLAYQTPQSWEFPLTVDGTVAGAGPATLQVRLWGSTDWPRSPDHHVVVALNGQTVLDRLFDGLTLLQESVVLPAGLLREGTNTVRVTLPGDSGVMAEVVSFDAVSVRYPRRLTAIAGGLDFESAERAFRVDGLPSSEVLVYEVNNRNTLRLLPSIAAAPGGGFTAEFTGGRGGRYFVASPAAVATPRLERERTAPADLTAGAASYLIISHADFLAGLEPLVAARRAEGLSVKVVDVADLYAAYSHGRVDPRAIRDYLAFAKANLGTTLVLLVGGDSYDYKGYRGTGARSFIPSLYVQTDPVLIHFAPSDPALADVDGDGIPDLAIGRFPVRTEAELGALISKTLAYATKPYGETAIFAADGADLAQNLAFAAASDRFAAGLPEGWGVERAYLDQLDVATARANLIAALESGVALTSFIGHSGPTDWTFSGLFSVADAAALQNLGRPTVVTQWGCWNTYYVSPTYEALGTKLVNSTVGGAAAVLGATTLTNAGHEEALGDALAALLARPGMRLGDAVLAAKRSLAKLPGMEDVQLGWTLLGDPALRIAP